MADGAWEEIYFSARKLGDIIDTPIRTIENWAASGNIQQDQTGKYGLISAFQYQLQKSSLDLGRVRLQLSEAKEELKKAEGDLVGKAFEAKNRKAIAEADKEEALAEIKRLELNKLKGTLVDSEDVLNTSIEINNKIKAKLISIPSKLALELSGLDQPEQIKIRLDQVVDETLLELSKI